MSEAGSRVAVALEHCSISMLVEALRVNSCFSDDNVLLTMCIVVKARKCQGSRKGDRIIEEGAQWLVKYSRMPSDHRRPEREVKAGATSEACGSGAQVEQEQPRHAARAQLHGRNATDRGEICFRITTCTHRHGSTTETEVRADHRVHTRRHWVLHLAVLA